MNSIELALDLLDHHISIARDAASDFDRAALFAASTILVRDMEAKLPEDDGYASEKLEQVRGHICAMIGYDIDNGHDIHMHHSWALGAMASLRSCFGKRE